MRKHFLILLLTIGLTISSSSQTRGVKIGYIDMEYILENVPDYNEAKNQLELKAQKWKQEIETKKNEITKLKEALKAEQILLTKELYEERQEEITAQENELLEYQEKRFGPKGDLIVQKALLIKPIQDQVFTAIQDISEVKKYDFVFDKSSDLTMLFAAKRFDISDQAVRAITRSVKREQLSKKQLKEEEAKEAKEELINENPELAERQKKIEETKANRERLIEERKAAAIEKKRLAEEKRLKFIADKEAKKTQKNSLTEKSTTISKDTLSKPTETIKQKTAEEKALLLEARKKALEEKKKKIIEEREAAKKAKAEIQKAK
jgi:Skp family chaperone for outer membrane proteins